MMKYNFFNIAFFAFCCVWLLSGCDPVSDETKNEMPSHVAVCSVGFATLEGIDKLPRPKLRDKIGDSILGITTVSDSAQIWFNQGLNLLHGFWHLEAYRAFSEVVKQDSTCAMGYWGMAMCQPGFGGTEAVWKESINRASELRTNTSPFENDLILASYNLTNQGMTEAVVADFRLLLKKYPDEPEAIAFAGIFMLYSGNVNFRDESIELLKAGLEKFPKNIAIGHYYTHAMEYTRDFIEAKIVAERVAKEGAKSPHLLHMPGHIYFLSGNYQAAVNTFEKAMVADEAYHKAEQIPYISNQNFLHNLHYLTIALAEHKEYGKAQQRAKQYATLMLKTPVPNRASENLYYYQGRLLPAFVEIRYRKWNEAVEMLELSLNKLDQPITNPLVRLYFQAMISFCKGMKAVETDDLTNANAAFEKMRGAMTEYNTLGLTFQATPEFALINRAYDIMDASRMQLEGWILNADAKKQFVVDPFRAALELEELIGYAEPPLLIYPVYESMGLCLKKRGDERWKGILGEALNKRPNSKVIIELMK